MSQETERQPAGEGAKGRSVWQWLAMAAFIVPMAVFLLPTTVVAAFLLLPTIVALLTDGTPGRSVTVTVGLLNGVGTLPAVMHLWTEGHHFAQALRTVGEPIFWLIAYGAAALGWGVFLGLPPLLRRYYQVATDTRIKQLRKRQDDLRDLWGDEVGGEEHEPEGPDDSAPTAFSTR